MALYMISFTSRGIILAFSAALFPQLVRNTPYSRELKKRREQGELSPETYEKEKIVERNRISSISMVRPRIWRHDNLTLMHDLVDLSFLWRCCCLVTELVTASSLETQSEG
jgi:hypothetical protein